MKPKGTIYHLGRSGTHGEILLFLPSFIRLIFYLVRNIGAGLIALAVLTFSFSYGPVLKQEIYYKLGELGLPVSNELIYSSDSIKSADAESILAVQKEAQGYGVTSYFSIVIPKIAAKANIIANVDVGKKDDYLEALKKGVAHAKGTFFPGQSGTIFLFSHSTDTPVNFARYNAVFYLLKKLENGDSILIFFADKKYEYEVVGKVTTTPTDTSWLVPKVGEEELVLMTCDPPGTTWRRLLVIAQPK